MTRRTSISRPQSARIASVRQGVDDEGEGARDGREDATALAASRSTSATHTAEAPDRAAASARARPMPPPPPVTTHTFPFRDDIDGSDLEEVGSATARLQQRLHTVAQENCTLFQVGLRICTGSGRA
mmetsp:Transcript_18269/g.52761  ORF Transcript_18269/g.52761 Transcript_18269/m.52761 type:complete len:127 (+) Transcript_18269:660-1040(+)